MKRTQGSKDGSIRKSRVAMKFAPLLALAGGLLMTVLFLYFTMSRGTASAEKELLKKSQIVKELWAEKHDTIPDNFLFINTGYDRQLTEVYDTDNFPKGNIDITDRSHLARLLSILNKERNYRAILLDVSFDSIYKSPDDSLLFGLLHEMPRIVVPRTSDNRYADSRISGKSAGADYRTNVMESDFTKYHSGDVTNPSMALKTWEFATGGKPTEHGAFCLVEGRLLRKKMMPSLDILVSPEGSDSLGRKEFYNLGADLLDDTEESTAQLCRDKIIFIGDFAVDDIHQTYRGNVPGVLIHANTVKDMLLGRHLISWWLLGALWLLFSLLLWLMLKGNPQKSWLESPKWLTDRAQKSKLWELLLTLYRWVVSLLGYSLLFMIIIIALKAITGQIYDLMIFGVIFAVIDRFISFLKDFTK